MSVGGITEKGLFNSNLLLVECERRMIRAAEEVWLVADSSKFGKSALTYLCDLSSVTRLIVDSGLRPEWQEIVTKAGVQLTLIDIEK